MEDYRIMKESAFQKKLIDDLQDTFQGCVIQKNDPLYRQGFPDLTIYYKGKWATLECKRSKDEPHRPNQDYYVDLLNGMSYSAFIFPENREDVIRDLKKLFM